MFNAYSMTADFCLDVLSLGEMDLGKKDQNPKPWDESKYFKSLRENSPLPHKIVFTKPWDELRSTVIEGYYYDNDGITQIFCDIIIQRDSFILDLESDMYMKAGCSGGPIFTKKHELIGVVTNLNIGVRLDITLPPIILDLFGVLPELEISDRGKIEKETPPDGWN